MSLNRRDFGRAMAVIGGLAAVRRLKAQLGSVVLPARQHLLLQYACVLTMDPALGDLSSGDVEIDNGQIVAVGESLEAPGAEVVDARDKIVLPGFVETHWHVWTSLLRSRSGSDGYFPVSRRLGSHYLPDDMYVAARLALGEAIHSGITFAHDWCHNVRDPAYAEAALLGLGNAGIRGRFSYGTPTGHPNDQPIDQAHFRELSENWRQWSHGGRVGLGLAWRGAGSRASLSDRAMADELGLPVSVHVNNSQSGAIERIADAGLLGPNVQLIHGIWSSEDEVAAVAASGASLSLSPFTEMRIGFGVPMTGEYLAAGVPVGLSVDTTALSGSVDMFAIMKAILNVENARQRDEFALSARRVLELATIDGARSMGIDDQTGSLTPGKRADVIVIDTRAINLGVFTDPVQLLVEAAQPQNIEAVLVDGRYLKRAGQLTALDVNDVIDDAQAALAALDERVASAGISL
jgi:cytosine/adenosine deaminase-related metal-dependent hydrolase